IIRMFDQIFGQTQSSGKPNGLRVAILCSPVNCWTSRIPEIEHPCDLIKGFTSSIIDGLTKELNIQNEVIQQEQFSMPTGNQQSNHRGLHIGDLISSGTE